MGQLTTRTGTKLRLKPSSTGEVIMPAIRRGAVGDIGPAGPTGDVTPEALAAQAAAETAEANAEAAQAAAEAAAADAEAITGLTGEDAAVAFLVDDTGSATHAAANTRISDKVSTDITNGASTTRTAIASELLAVTDGGLIAGAGGPTRPNVQLGGALNGTTIDTDQIHGVILQPGGPGYNNIIGGDGTATVGTVTPNVVDPAIGNCGVSLIGGYDNVAGQISSKIIADHSYTEPGGSGHNGIYGGTGHIMRTAANHSMIAGGRSLDVGGAFSLTTGDQNDNNGAHSFVSGWTNVLASSQASVVGGQSNTVNTSYANVTGYQNTADAAALFADMHGANGKARAPFVTVRSSGKISADGDSQHAEAHYRGQSTSATQLLLIAAYTGAGASSQYLMVEGQTAVLTATVVAKTAAGATVGAWTIRGVAQWLTGGGAPTWLGGTPAPTALYTDGSAATTSLLLGAGGSAGRVFVACTGIAATTINWSAKFEAVEVVA